MAKILVVDDDTAARELISFVLEKDKHEIFTASNGQEAIEKLQALRPDLILMDVMMPIMDGITATGKIKQDASLASIPIIILSSLGKEMEIQQGMEAGADSYITKPFKPKDLSGIIAKYLIKEG